MKSLFTFLLLAALTATGFAQQSSIDPIGHWRFSGDADDQSVNHLHGQMRGTVADSGIAGRPNTALKFDGSSSYVAVPHDSVLNLQAYTIVSVFRPDDFYRGLCQGNMLVKKGGDHYGEYGFGMVFDDNSCDNQDCFAFDSTQMVITPNQAFSNTDHGWCDTLHILQHNWYRAIIRFDGIDSVQIFINGQKSAHQQVTTWNAYTTDSMVFGRNGLYAYNDPYPYFFNGVFDNLLIYNRALSDSEASVAGCEPFITEQPVDDSAANNGTAQFTVGAHNVRAYQWQQQDSENGGFVNVHDGPDYSGANTATLTVSNISSAMSGDRYRCVLTNVIRCADTSVEVQLATRSTDVEAIEHLDAQLTVSPNPCKGAFRVRCVGRLTGAAYQLCDATGRIVRSGALQEHETLVRAEAAPGVYFLTVQLPQGKMTRKVVIE